MVEILALAHERACEGELAATLHADLEARRLPDIARLRARFTPDPASLPKITVAVVPLEAYQALLGPAAGDVA